MAKFLSLSLLLLLFFQLPAQEDFRVVGYLPYYRFSLIDQINFEQLTHLNIAFANPDMEGQLDVGGEDITPVVEKAKQHGLTVMISLAGGALLQEWEEAWNHLMTPANRSGFIHKIIQYVEGHGLDGVDFDLEWSHVNALYSPFVLELKDSLDAHSLLLTAALPGTTRYSDISDEALDAFDWINMMVYDLTGPWAPNNPGPHSPYNFAISSINYWFSQGVGADRLTLGVPFYGWDFSGNQVSSFTYRTIVAENPDNAFTDQVGAAYYNGIPTIQNKTVLAMELLSGIMIWEIGQDSYTEYSLLNAIYETVYPPANSSEPAITDALSVYPNPFSEELYVQNEADSPIYLRLAAMDGRAIQEFTLGARASQWLNTAALAPGMYVLQVVGQEIPQAYKILRY